MRKPSLAEIEAFLWGMEHAALMASQKQRGKSSAMYQAIIKEIRLLKMLRDRYAAQLEERADTYRRVYERFTAPDPQSSRSPQSAHRYKQRSVH